MSVAREIITVVGSRVPNELKLQGSAKRRSPRFGEFCYCSCLPLLPVFTCSFHATWGPPFSRALKYNGCIVFGGDPKRRGAWAHPPSRDPALDKKGHSPLTLLLNHISSRARCVSTLMTIFISPSLFLSSSRIINL